MMNVYFVNAGLELEPTNCMSLDPPEYKLLWYIVWATSRGQARSLAMRCFDGEFTYPTQVLALEYDTGTILPRAFDYGQTAIDLSVYEDMINADPRIFTWQFGDRDHYRKCKAAHARQQPQPDSD